MAADTIPEELQDQLQADATLTAIVASANIYVSRSFGAAFINEDDTSDAYEEVGSSGVMRLKPVVVISPSSGPDPASAAGCGRREWFRIGVYDRDDYVDTEAMLDAIHDVLHDQWFDLSDGTSFQCEHVDTPYRHQMDETVMSGTDKPTSYEAARYVCTTDW